MTSSTSFLRILGAIKNNYPDAIPKLAEAKRKIYIYFHGKQSSLLTIHSHLNASDPWVLNSFAIKTFSAQVLGMTTLAGLLRFLARLWQSSVSKVRLQVLYNQAANLASPGASGCRQDYWGWSAESPAKSWATRDWVSHLWRQEPEAAARLLTLWLEAGCPWSSGRCCWSHQELQLLCRELLHSRPPEAKGQSNSTSQRQHSSRYRGSAFLKQGGPAWIIWEEKMTSQKFHILNARKKKPISSDHRTQAAFFLGARLL